MSLLVVAAVSVAGVAADFDGDGRMDKAYLRVEAGITELVVERATGEIVVIDRMKDAENFYLAKIVPGNYRSACSKGAGLSSVPCTSSSIAVTGEALQFGTKEASQAVALWANGRFEVHWLSD